MCEFSKSDVITMAKTILDTCICVNGENSRDYYYCNHCNGKSVNDYDETIKHEKDCPVLIAQDILTRVE